MKIFLVKDLGPKSYDTYDSAVVYAESEEAARNVPVGDSFSGWLTAPLNAFSVECVGKAKAGSKPGIILASFNAG
jgi:hypothetical protein